MMGWVVLVLPQQDLKQRCGHTRQASLMSMHGVAMLHALEHVIEGSAMVQSSCPNATSVSSTLAIRHLRLDRRAFVAHKGWRSDHRSRGVCWSEQAAIQVVNVA